MAAIMSPPSESRIIEIGGADRVTYAELMREYARQRRLRRRVIPTELIRPKVSSLALARVPLYGQIAASMATSLRNATVVQESSAPDVFQVRPHGVAAAVERALRHEDHQFAEMDWGTSSALSPRSRWGGTPVGRRRVSSRAMTVQGDPDEAFARIQRIGGTTGWYSVDWFWRLRGLLDRLRGGTGFRRGRRDPHHLRVGDRVDFWRVERLRAGTKAAARRRDEASGTAMAPVRGRSARRDDGDPPDDGLRPGRVCRTAVLVSGLSGTPQRIWEPTDGSVGGVTGRVGMGRVRRGRVSRGRSRLLGSGSRSRVV